MENDELRKYQVIVAKPLFAGGKIWEPKVYDDPPMVLVQCAKENFEKENPVVYFGKDGAKINPFATVTMVGEIPPEDPEDDGEDGDGDVSTFIDGEKFASLSKTEQLNYITEIKDTPEELDPEEAEKYEADLYDALNVYNQVATGTKALELIEEVLALYK